jgi:integrase
MAVYDRWHLSKAPKDPNARKCSQHRKYPSSEHGKGLQYQVRGEDQDGQPFRQSFEYVTDADDKDAELRLSVKSGTFIDERAGTVTLRAFAEEWRKNRVHDPRTATRIKSSFENHVYQDPRPGAVKGKTKKGGVAIGDYPMRVLARKISLSQTWIRGLPLHANTSIMLIKDLSQVYKAACDDKIIPANPLLADSLQRPDPVTGEAVVWEPGRIEAVAAALPGELHAMPYLGASCGHRQGELCGAAVEDVDFLRKTCAIEYQVKYADITGVPDVTTPARSAPLSGWHLVYGPVKNRKSRKGIPVADSVILKLSEHLAARPAAAVTLPFLRADDKLDGDMTRRLIFSNHGQPWYQGTLAGPWRRARKAAGVPDAARVGGFHVLRHTFASQCLSNGLSLAKTAAFLGDTKEVVLRTYAHFMPADDDLARVIVNGFFAPPESGENAREMTSSSPAGRLCLVSAVYGYFWTK